MNKPTFGPKCPNHGEYLEGIGFPMPEQGVGICPVSGAPFEFSIEVDQDITVVDKDGNVTKQTKWHLDGSE